ncbi:MAG TPA: putative glycoside hydrolase [Clostridiales bacterium]|jgi:hypothetical protein|nr:putative glycoside hydrolase [Clostridiales bacterium]
MRKRRNKDMYIDYSKSYLYRRRSRGSKIAGIIIVVILAFVFGIGTYYAVRIKTGGEYRLNRKHDMADNNEENSAEIIPSPVITTAPINDDTGEEEVVDESDTRTPVRVKGLYVTSRAIMDKRDEIIEIADTTEINALVIDVKDDNGRITFQMDSPKAQEIGATTNTISDIDALMRLLKIKNIYPIARIVAFKDPYLAEQRHELAIKNKDGSLYRDNNGECWVNPYEKEVWDYLIEVSTKAAEAGFMEIQFDYIRFSTGKGMSNADFGPLAEEKTKEDIIIEFTQYAYESLKPLGVFVSADVYGTIISSSIDAGLVGQNYVEMSKYLDYICPMIYPSHFADGNYGVEHPDLEPFNIIRKVLRASKNKLNEIPEGEHRAIVRPWLQDFTATWIKNYQEYGPSQIREQISGVYVVGYSEWLLWNASCNYTVDALRKE